MKDCASLPTLAFPVAAQQMTAGKVSCAVGTLQPTKSATVSLFCDVSKLLRL